MHSFWNLNSRSQLLLILIQMIVLPEVSLADRISTSEEALFGKLVELDSHIATLLQECDADKQRVITIRSPARIEFDDKCKPGPFGFTRRIFKFLKSTGSVDKCNPTSAYKIVYRDKQSELRVMAQSVMIKEGEIFLTVLNSGRRVKARLENINLVTYSSYCGTIGRSDSLGSIFTDWR